MSSEGEQVDDPETVAALELLQEGDAITIADNLTVQQACEEEGYCPRGSGQVCVCACLSMRICACVHMMCLFVAVRVYAGGGSFPSRDRCRHLDAQSTPGLSGYRRSGLPHRYVSCRCLKLFLAMYFCSYVAVQVCVCVCMCVGVCLFGFVDSRMSVCECVCVRG